MNFVLLPCKNSVTKYIQVLGIAFTHFKEYLSKGDV